MITPIYSNPLFWDFTAHLKSESGGEKPELRRTMYAKTGGSCFGVMMMTNLKTDRRALDQRAFKKGSAAEVKRELKWLHRRIEELGDAIAGRQNAIREMPEERSAETRFASENSGSIYELASHNLLNPLRKIRVFGEMAAHRWGNSAEALEYLARLQRAALRMQRVLEGLQLYSRVEKRDVDFSVVDLERAVGEAVAKFDKRIRNTGAEIEVESLPSVEADGQLLRMLFENLIDNSLKFRSENRRPHIRICEEKEERGPSESRLCRILVEDNGIGFQERHFEEVFSPFHELHWKEDYDGVGMGLAICKKIMDRHGGGITARSTAGKGSVFILTFPRQKVSDGTT